MAVLIQQKAGLAGLTDVYRHKRHGMRCKSGLYAPNVWILGGPDRYFVRRVSSFGGKIGGTVA